jgi:dienelactone hydrolase
MTRRDLLRLSAAAACTGSPLALAADEPAKPKSPDEMIHAYLAAEVKRISTRFMDGVKTKEEWQAARPRLKREFLDMLGLDPLPAKTPLKATVAGKIERSGVSIEKVHFQSKPGLYVTGNVYLPPSVEEKKKKYPAILYVCGHSGRGRDGNKTAFQDHGLWFASNGYVCLVIDTLQLGEVAGVHHGTYNLERWWWQDEGYTPAGVECWNGIRAIDYLVSRSDVDSERIGVTGISGGGATTCWIAAADDRVKVAVPVSGMSDLECYVTDKVVNGHCDCMFPVNTYQWELTTILALHAPKPLLFANSDNDPIFPMSGNRRIAERMRKCYAMLGEKDNFDDYVSKGGHDYRPDLRVAIFTFFQRHLKLARTPAIDADFEKIAGKDLRVFPTDADLPKDSINDKIDETFVPTAKVTLPVELKGFAGWKLEMLKQLREKCFRALPEKVPGAKYLRSDKEGKFFEFSPEPGIECTSRVDVEINGAVFTCVVAGAEEDFDEAAKFWIDRYNQDTSFRFVIKLRGGFGRRWLTKNPPNTVERSLALLGQTVDSGRVRDCAAFVAGFWDSKRKKDDARLRLTGKGQAGVIAAYAALFVPGATDEVVVLDPPTSHRDGPHFLNVLRVLDIPEALGLLAPDIKLTLVGKNAKDKAFDRTAALYKAAGAADKFKRE